MKLSENPTPKELAEYIVYCVRKQPTRGERLMFLGKVLYVLGAQEKYPGSWE